jgi:hypothetical protein
MGNEHRILAGSVLALAISGIVAGTVNTSPSTFNHNGNDPAVLAQINEPDAVSTQPNVGARYQTFQPDTVSNLANNQVNGLNRFANISNFTPIEQGEYEG